jgi:hypothetical protein
VTDEAGAQRLAYDLLSELPLERWEREGGIPTRIVAAVIVVASEKVLREKVTPAAWARAAEHLTVEALVDLVLPHMDGLARGGAEAAASRARLEAALEELFKRVLGPGGA